VLDLELDETELSGHGVVEWDTVVDVDLFEDELVSHGVELGVVVTVVGGGG